MIYAMGIGGFFGGFIFGQMLLMYMLRHKTNEELRTDKKLRIYGILNWVVAGLGAATMVVLYHKYIG